MLRQRDMGMGTVMWGLVSEWLSVAAEGESRGLVGRGQNSEPQEVTGSPQVCQEEV